MRPADEQAVAALWARMADGWRQASGARFAEVFTPDAVLISVRGDEQTGRDGIARTHQRLFRDAYAGTRLVVGPLTVRSLSADIAVVHVRTRVERGPAPAMLTHAQAVVQRQDDGWRIAALHNMSLGTPAPDGRS